jgi:glutaredoxin 3
MKIEVYMRENPPCPFCINAKKWLENNGLAFVQHDVMVGDNKSQLDARLGHPAMTVPQIFVNDQLIGGYTDLVKSDLVKSQINKDLGSLSL